jgi:hypothetical protein
MDEELKQNLIYATLQTSINSPFNISAGNYQRVFTKNFRKNTEQKHSQTQKITKKTENKQPLKQLLANYTQTTEQINTILNHK